MIINTKEKNKLGKRIENYRGRKQLLLGAGQSVNSGLNEKERSYFNTWSEDRKGYSKWKEPE